MDLSEFVADVVKEALRNPGANAEAVLARAQSRVADMLEGKTALWGKVPGATGVSRPAPTRSPAAPFMTPPRWRVETLPAAADLRIRASTLLSRDAYREE